MKIRRNAGSCQNCHPELFPGDAQRVSVFVWLPSCVAFKTAFRFENLLGAQKLFYANVRRTVFKFMGLLNYPFFSGKVLSGTTACSVCRMRYIG